MTFLSTASEKMFLIMEKNQKQYEKNIGTLRYNAVKRNMDYLSEQYRDMDDGSGENTADVSDDPLYQYYERISEQLEVEMEALQTDIDTLKEQITSMANTIKDGIKSSCGLTLSGS